MNKKLTLLAALALGGCTLVAGSSQALLQASSWQLQGAAVGTFTLQITGDKVTGMGGCNRYFGGIVRQDETVLTLSALGATRMMCLGALADKEAHYLQTLGKVATYRIKDQQLILSDANKQDLLSFEAVPAAN